MYSSLSSGVMVIVAIVSIVAMTTPTEAAYVEYPLQQEADKQILLAQLRSEVKRLQLLTDVLANLRSLGGPVAEESDGSLNEALGEEKRSGRSGSPRRYDSYGVAGRFGRSVQRQVKPVGE